MNLSFVIILSAVSLLFSCQPSTNKTADGITISPVDPLQQETIPETSSPVFGYRFIISGDFNGDGKQEMLTEHYFSRLDNKETNKFYDSLVEYDQLVALTLKKKPYSFVSSNSKVIDTLYISSSEQLLGLSFFKNEGDLNGDGTDEVSYVIDHADWSSLNTWYIVTFKNKQWTTLYSFPIWDWQLPDLPESFDQQELFGIENERINSEEDTFNAQLKKKLQSFKGLVTKIGTNKIKVIFRNENAEQDTMIVDLKKTK